MVRTTTFWAEMNFTRMLKHTKPLDREIISVTLINGHRPFPWKTSHVQQDKPYYVPDRSTCWNAMILLARHPESSRQAFSKNAAFRRSSVKTPFLEEFPYGVCSAAAQTGDVLTIWPRFVTSTDGRAFTALYSAFHGQPWCYSRRMMMQMTPPRIAFVALLASEYPLHRRNEHCDFAGQILTVGICPAKGHA